MLHVFAEGQRRLIELFATTKLADLAPAGVPYRAAATTV
jgi:hypothetical protein